MKVMFLEVELLIEESRSLKQKRHIIKGLKEKVKTKFNASVIECGYQDKWQRAQICCVFIRADSKEVDKTKSAVISFLEVYPGIILVDYNEERLA